MITPQTSRLSPIQWNPRGSGTTAPRCQIINFNYLLATITPSLYSDLEDEVDFPLEDGSQLGIGFHAYCPAPLPRYGSNTPLDGFSQPNGENCSKTLHVPIKQK